MHGDPAATAREGAVAGRDSENATRQSEMPEPEIFPQLMEWFSRKDIGNPFQKVHASVKEKMQNKCLLIF